MKKTLRTIIAILTAGLMLMAFAACDEKKDDADTDNIVKEDTYFIEDLENKTAKIYVAEKWNIG